MRDYLGSAPVGGLPSRNKKDSSFRVTAELLIPGRGEPIRNACVVVKDGKITHAGSRSDVDNRYSHLPTTHVKVLMPGMWDCHVHFMGIHKISMEAIVQSQQQPVLSGARTARDCMLLLNAGFTSVREMAGYGIQLAEAISEGSLVGPNIYSANCIISPTGGHADAHVMHKDWFDDACRHGLPNALADGVPECLKVVRMQLRAGAKVIKICASGGVGSELDNPIDQQFSDEEIKTIVEEATRAQRIVGAHCHGKLGIMAALRSGVKTIEHGSFLDEEVANLMLEKDAILVSTRTVIAIALEMGKAILNPRSYEKLLDVAIAHEESMKIAVRKGVKMATGCDIPGSAPGSMLTHGINGVELLYHVQAGMTPLKAIEAATANGPLTLGPQAPNTGQLRECFDADFIALEKNPLEDISVLSEAANITHVWKAGKRFKGPGQPVSSI